MKRAGALLVLWAASFGNGCSKPASDSVVYVTVTAPAGLPPVTQLRVNLSYAGRTDTELFPQTNSKTAISFVPAATFVLDLPPSSSGSIDIAIDAVNSAGSLVSHGEKLATIVTGGRTDITVVLGPGDGGDGGVLGLDASENIGTGGTVGTGGMAGSGGWAMDTGGAAMFDGSTGASDTKNSGGDAKIPDATDAQQDIPVVRMDGSVDGPMGLGGITGTTGTDSDGRTSGTCDPVCAVDSDCVGGTCVPSPWYGMACTSAQDCPAGTTCCDGSNESCDGTRLPSGDSANPGEFTVSADGLTVADSVTGLIWQADGLGPRAGCTTDSTNLTCTLAEAEEYCAGLVLGGSSDWRLPALHELRTIVDFTQYKPSTLQSLFPNTTSDFYWSSSPTAWSSPRGAWILNFSDGNLGNYLVGALYRVRCVRGSRCYPTSRFLVLPGGQVRDRLTNLVWQQQASAPPMKWFDALSYCSAAGSGFRLPTVKELDSIVDLTVTSGATINQTAFPNATADWFWASSPYAGSSSGNAWFVSFNSGVSVIFGEGNLYSVRCVRYGTSSTTDSGGDAKIPDATDAQQDIPVVRMDGSVDGPMGLHRPFHRARSGGSWSADCQPNSPPIASGTGASANPPGRCANSQTER